MSVGLLIIDGTDGNRPGWEVGSIEGCTVEIRDGSELGRTVELFLGFADDFPNGVDVGCESGRCVGVLLGIVGNARVVGLDSGLHVG